MITKYSEYCVLCGYPNVEEHHLICGTGKKRVADEYGLTIPVCRKCHDKLHASPEAMKMCKIAGQLAFEKQMVAKGESEDEAREHFRSRFSKSYL